MSPTCASKVAYKVTQKASQVGAIIVEIWLEIAELTISLSESTVGEFCWKCVASTPMALLPTRSNG